MELTNEELGSIFDIIYDEVYYGDDHFVYGDEPQAVAARSGLEKLREEIERRGI